jgi:hypothetical protein
VDSEEIFGWIIDRILMDTQGLQAVCFLNSSPISAKGARFYLFAKGKRNEAETH